MKPNQFCNKQAYHQQGTLAGPKGNPAIFGILCFRCRVGMEVGGRVTWRLKIQSHLTSKNFASHDIWWSSLTWHFKVQSQKTSKYWVSYDIWTVNGQAVGHRLACHLWFCPSKYQIFLVILKAHASQETSECSQASFQKQDARRLSSCQDMQTTGSSPFGAQKRTRFVGQKFMFLQTARKESQYIVHNSEYNLRL